jgi:hypothetical protein
MAEREVKSIVKVEHAIQADKDKSGARNPTPCSLELIGTTY